MKNTTFNFLILLFIISSTVFSQTKKKQPNSVLSNTCSNPIIACNYFTSSANVSCSNGSITYAAITGNTPCIDGLSNTNYGCLYSQPNQTWFYFTVNSGSTLNFTITNSSNIDVDAAVWGPISNLADGCNATLSAPKSCDYGTDASPQLDLAGVNAGEIYVLVITNFDDIATNVTVNQPTGGSVTFCKVDPTQTSIVNKAACYAFSTNTIDGIGQNNGVNNGAILTTDRANRDNHAYNFNGNSYISIPTVGLTNGESYTYSAWVNPANLPSFGQAYTLFGIGGQTMLLVNSTFYNRIVWNYISYNTNSVSTSLVTPSGFSISANQWTHFVAVKDGTTTKMYINGQLVATGVFSGITNYSGGGFIGKRAGVSNQNMYGKVDDVQIFNAALNDSQVLALYNENVNNNCDAYIHNESGLISCYAFSGDAKDEVSNNHGIANNVSLTTDRFGSTNSAYTFAGNTSSFIELTNASTFTNQQYSYSLWMKSNSLPSYGTQGWLVEVGGSLGDQALYVSNYANGIVWASHSYGTPTGCLAARISDHSNIFVQANKWFHVVITMGTNQNSMYIDGKLVSTSSHNCSSFFYGSNPVASIGIRYISSTNKLSPFNGVIDDVRIYNRAITAEEVQSLRYTKGCRTKCADYSTIASPYNSPLPPTRVEASTISGVNIINSNTEIRYDASKSIVLQPGFRVEQGAIFEAYIDGCGRNK